MLLSLIIILLPLASSLVITNTTFFASETGYTIFVDSVTLDSTNVTNTSIEFDGVNSVLSRFTNTNLTTTAVANFVNLQDGFFIRNLNTSLFLFSSVLGNQDFNASFSPGQIIEITDTFIPQCTQAERPILNLILIFTGLIIMLAPIIFLFVKGNLIDNVDLKFFIMVFIIIMVGLVMLVASANNLGSFCDLG